jgi:lipoprotein-anchoring transpeptidase ErfK/SrfK
MIRTSAAVRSPLWLVLICAAAGLGATPRHTAAPLAADAINNAQFAEGKKGKTNDGPLLVKVEVLLDRAGFSPGAIDSRNGDNFKKALTAFQKQNGLDASGRLDTATFDKLSATSKDPVVTDYEITQGDVEGPYVKRIPASLEGMAELPELGYISLREALAEKFHMAEPLLAALNRHANFDRAGTRIVVANVRRDSPRGKVAKIVVDKNARSLSAFDEKGELLAFYPASIGSQEKPAPSGEFKVRTVQHNPIYHYDPRFAFKGVKAKEKFTIKAGPNNPVGLVWIDLTAPSYGIHGTPSPEKVSKTESHGCVRLTNWDALDLAAMVHKGTVVDFQG